MAEQQEYEKTIRERNKDSMQRASMFWISLANESLSQLNRQLLGLAIVFIPLTASLIILNVPLSFEIKMILILIWLMLLVSIISGLTQIYFDVKYFVYLSRDASQREKIWSDASKKISLAEYETKILGEVEESGGHISIIIQATTLIFALLLSITIGIIFLSR